MGRQDMSSETFHEFHVTDKIIKQSEFVIELLNDASDLILYKKLVPVKKEEILRYIKGSGKVFPPDFFYWLTTYGSGIIDFVNDSVDIPSINDLIENEMDGRYWSKKPKDCWKRISLGYAGAPQLLALDSTIIDSDGCCPVITTVGYEDIVEEVLASSWPMYLIRRIIKPTKDALSKISIEKESAANKFELLSFHEIDMDLKTAHSKAMLHNETESDDKEHEEFMNNSLGEFTSHYLDEIEAGEFREKKINNLNETISFIDKCMEHGISSFIDATMFIEEETTKRDLDKLYTLLEHPSRDVRGRSFLAIRRLLKGKKIPEKLKILAKKTSDIELVNNINKWGDL
jgi:hypothetical protein